MSNKRVIHVEISDKVEVNAHNIEKELQRLAELAEDSYDLEKILGNVVFALYTALPNGQENYGGAYPLVGKVWLSRFNCKQPGKAAIEYNPSYSYRDKFRYDQKGIGMINLRDKTYSRAWSDKYVEGFSEVQFGIPEILMKDTDKVMESLGLTKQDKK